MVWMKLVLLVLIFYRVIRVGIMKLSIWVFMLFRL